MNEFLNSTESCIYTGLSKNTILRRAKILNINPFKIRRKRKCLFTKEELNRIRYYIQISNKPIVHTVHLHTVYHIYESKLNTLEL
jgi:hypothetical protein